MCVIYALRNGGRWYKVLWKRDERGAKGRGGFVNRPAEGMSKIQDPCVRMDGCGSVAVVVLGAACKGGKRMLDEIQADGSLAAD